MNWHATLTPSVVRSFRALRLLGAALGLLGLAACSDQARSTLPAGSAVPSAPVAQASPAAAFSVPFPRDTSSGSTPLTLNGSQASETSPNAVDQDSALQLDSRDNGAPEYAIYRFSTTAQAGYVTAQVATGTLSEVWFGVADFAAQRWDFAGPFGPLDTPQLALDPARHFSQFGHAYVLLLVRDYSVSTVQQLRLVAGNAPPAAQLAITPPAVDPQAAVTLDAAGSHDPDGVSVGYDWDLDDNGSFELNTSGVNHTQTSFATPGVHVVRVRVTDSAGATTVRLGQVVVHGWQGTTVDTSGDDTGYAASLVVAGGNPALCYFDSYKLTLCYVRALDSSGTQWGTPLTLDHFSYPSTYTYTAMTLIAGRPGIAYFDQDGPELKYIQAQDANGWGWGDAVSTAHTGGYAQGFALADVGGRAGLSYCDTGASSELCFKRATDDAGLSWPSAAVMVDPAAGSGVDNSLAMVDGRPAIAYAQHTTGALQYVRALDGAGAAWGAAVFADAAPDTGGGSLAVIGGKPAIAFRDYSNSDGLLSVVRALDSGGATWAKPQALANTAHSSDGVLVSLLGANPAIAYYDTDARTVQLISALTPDAGVWDSPVTVGAGWVAGSSPCLCAVEGQPALAFYDLSNGQFTGRARFIRRY